MDTAPAAAPAPRSRAAMLLLGAAIVAVALNQRPAVVSVAPVLEDLRADTHLSAALAGLLTTVPVLCFGAFAPVAPRMARRIGLETAVAFSLALLAAGIGLRLLTPVALLYAGSLVAGAAIAIANVLLPAYVKREFARPGPMMGVYTAALNAGAAAGAAATLPLAAALGVDWRVALGLWGVLAVAALVLWLPVLLAGRAAHRAAPPAVTAGGGAWALLRSGLAWQVTVYFGLQSALFYSFAAWLPTLLAGSGISEETGGLLLGLNNVVGAAGALITPVLAGRMRSQRPLLAVVVALYVVGLAGLLVAPGTGTVAWVCIFGVAQGSGFALALMFTVLRSATPLVAAQLGGVAQCLGYLLAAVGPLALGGVHDLTGGWTWPLALLLIVLAPMAWAGWGAARDAVVTAPARRDVVRTP